MFICWMHGLPRWCSGKESTSKCRRCRFDPWVRKIPWRRKWKSTPVFLPGKAHGQRSLEVYRQWGHKRIGHHLPTKQQQQMLDALLFNCSFMSNSLRSHGLQHARLPWPSPFPWACSNLCSLNWWCHPTILSSVFPSPPAFSLSQYQGFF